MLKGFAFFGIQRNDRAPQRALPRGKNVSARPSPLGCQVKRNRTTVGNGFPPLDQARFGEAVDQPDGAWVGELQQLTQGLDIQAWLMTKEHQSGRALAGTTRNALRRRAYFVMIGKNKGAKKIGCLDKISHSRTMKPDCCDCNMSLPKAGQIACEDSGFNTQLNEEGLFLMTGVGYYLPVVLARVFGKRQYTSQRAEWMT